MLGAPTLEDVLAHSRREDGAACCILLAPPFTKVGRDDVIPRIGYLDHRSGQYVHFYCAGYGGYWHPDIVPDMEEIGNCKYEGGTIIPWSFSQTLFAKFVDDLERITKWRYSGNAELIFLNRNVDFSNALVMDIDAMVRDDGVHSSAELFESIIRYCRNAEGNPSAYDFSDKKGAKIVGKQALEALLSFLPKPAQGIWKKGRHYAVHNIAA